nr:speedy protein A-like isoform X4 [Odocoileus virginianus texanus]
MGSRTLGYSPRSSPAAKRQGLSEFLTGRLGVHPKPTGLSKEKRANGREGRGVPQAERGPGAQDFPGKERYHMQRPQAARNRSPLASSPAPLEAGPEQRTRKMRGRKRKKLTGVKAEDPVIQSFLEADIFLKVSDKYLLSMVVEYFGRVGLPGHLYNRIHFFLAL